MFELLGHRTESRLAVGHICLMLKELLSYLVDFRFTCFGGGVCLVSFGLDACHLARRLGRSVSCWLTVESNVLLAESSFSPRDCQTSFSSFIKNFKRSNQPKRIVVKISGCFFNLFLVIAFFSINKNRGFFGRFCV